MLRIRQKKNNNNGNKEDEPTCDIRQHTVLHKRSLEGITITGEVTLIFNGYLFVMAIK